MPAGQVLGTVPVGRQPHDSIAVGPDTVFVADELADTIHIVRNGAITFDERRSTLWITLTS